MLDRAEAVFIDGRWQQGQGATPINAIDPSTGHAFAQFLPASVEQVAQAAEAASEAFSRWRRASGTERAGYLKAIAAGLKARKDALVGLQMLNSGKPRFEAEIDVDDAAGTFDYYAGLAETLDSEQGRPVALGQDGLDGATYFEPIGPVALIVAWNFPLVTTAWKLAPALAAGCTAVLKPSEFTTLAELAYGDIAMEAGLPAGVLNIVPGAGEIGAALSGNRRFRKISFTGSNTTGARVMAAAAQRAVPVSLELGGKSPIVILDDADIGQAVEAANRPSSFLMMPISARRLRLQLPASSTIAARCARQHRDCWYPTALLTASPKLSSPRRQRLRWAATTCRKRIWDR
jgi:betaine-aldehyde dehydrogenase